MKKLPISRILILTFFMLFWFAASYSQNDTIGNKIKKEKIKKGWNLGGFPVLAYDSDLGFEFGALVNLYHYGDGGRYPVYDHSLYLEASWYTKGSGIFRFYYDTDKLIKGIRTSLDISYIPDQAYNFYGFNGYESVYNDSWTNSDEPTYKSRLYYNYKRQFFRVKSDFLGNISNNGKLKWLAGIDFYTISQNTLDIDRLNKGKEESKQLPDTAVLFDQYIDDENNAELVPRWQIIPESEVDGGFFTVVKLGAVFDTRDNEPNPMKGIWTEIILASAPKPTSSMEQGFMKLAITHRQYFTIVKNKLSFVYRLAYQGTILGYTPTYAQQVMYYSKMTGAYNEGLGGIKTLRGIKRNRIIGDGWLMGNFEVRWKFVNFQWINQNWYLALSGFFDTGKVIQYIDVQNIVENTEVDYPGNETKEDYFKFEPDNWHNSVGGGLHIAMNQNFIIAIDYGKALNQQDGDSGLYIGLNFLF
jgi:hypothetical protein